MQAAHVGGMFSPVLQAMRGWLQTQAIAEHYNSPELPESTGGHRNVAIGGSKHRGGTSVAERFGPLATAFLKRDLTGAQSTQQL